MSYVLILRLCLTETSLITLDLLPQFGILSFQIPRCISFLSLELKYLRGAIRKETYLAYSFWRFRGQDHQWLLWFRHLVRLESGKRKNHTESRKQSENASHKCSPSWELTSEGSPPVTIIGSSPPLTIHIRTWGSSSQHIGLWETLKDAYGYYLNHNTSI